MAYGNIKGITIEIDGDTSKLTTALINVDKQARDTNRNLRDIKESLKYDKSKGPELAAQKQRELANAVKNTKEKLEILKQGQAEMTEEFKKTSEGQSAYDELTREIWKTERQLKSFEAQSERSYQQLAKVRDVATDFGDTAQKIGRDMTKKLTLPIAGAASAASKITMDFDASMSKVKAISGASEESFEALRAKAREMGATTQFSASEAADALTYMAMAGWDDHEMLDGLDGVMNLAAASGEDLATTSDIVTDALSAFKLEASDSSHFADVLAKASASSNTNVAMMGETFNYVAPVAGTLGYSIEDTAVAIGLMANNGIKGQKAGTALRAGLTRLAAPTKSVRDGMDMLGLSIEDVQGKSLDETLRIFRSSFANLDKTQQAQAASMIFGKEAMSGMLAIINTSESDYNSLSDAIHNADGAAESMAETMMDNLGGQIKILKSALEELAISFGDLLMPKLRDIVDGITEFVNKLNELPGPAKEIIAGVAIFLAALGPLLLVIGKISSAIGLLAGAMAVMKGSFVGSTASMRGLATILTGIKNGFSTLATFITGHFIPIVVVASLALIAYEIYKHWDEIKEFLINTWNAIKEIASNIWTGIAEFFGGIWEGVKERWTEFWGPIGEWLGEKIQAMIDVIQPIIDTFVNVFKVAWMLIEEIFRTTWELISGFFIENWQAFVEMARIILEPLKEFFTNLWTGIKETASIIWNGIKEFLQGVWQGIYDVAKPIFDSISGFIAGIWEGIKTTTSIIWNGIKTFLSGIWEGIKTVVASAINIVKGTIERVWNGIKTTTSTVWNGIKSAIEGPISAAKRTVETVVGRISTFVSRAWDGITTTTSRVWEGIKNSIAEPIEKARDIVRDAIDAIKGFFDINLQFPHIKLPHFGISGGFSLNPPQVPNFTIDWYKKGAIFTKPTLFNTPFGMKGVGEAGAEAVLPIEKLSSIMAEALRKNQDMSVSGVTVTGNTFNVREESDIDKIARELYRMIESKKRGVGLG